LLVPFAHCPKFVVYFESIKAKLEKKRLLTYISLIKVIRGHYPKLTWSQGDMKKIAHETAKLAADQWLRGLTKDELVDYAKRMGLKLRTLFYHARQAELKATKWLMKELNSDVSPSVDKAKELKRMRPKRPRAKATTSRRKRQRTNAKRRRPKRLRKRRRPRRPQSLQHRKSLRRLRPRSSTSSATTTSSGKRGGHLRQSPMHANRARTSCRSPTVLRTQTIR
jgi:hypothetical protein